MKEETNKGIHFNNNFRCIDKRSSELPKLAVIICCYQQSLFVAESLARTTQLQSLISFELLFIDDGSTDGSFDIALDWQRSTQMPLLLISKNNCGLVDSLNLALTLARAPYIFFISADDLIIPEALPKLVNLMETNLHLRFAMGNGKCFGYKIRQQSVYGEAHKIYLTSPADERPGYLPSQFPGSLLIQTTVFQTNFLRELGGWNPDIRLDDLQIFYRIFSKQVEPGKDFIYDHKLIVSEYRRHANNIHKRIIRQFDIYEEFVRKAISKDYQSSEYSFALAMYIVQALLTMNLNALIYLLRFAQREHLLWMTFRNILIRLLNKTKIFRNL